MLANEIERQERMTQVIEHAHEDHDVKALGKRAHVVDGKLAKLDVHLGDFRRKSGLRQISIVEVEAENALRTPPLHLDRVEAGIAPDVENRLSAEIFRDCILELPPFHMRIVAEKMVRRSGDAVELDIVEPGPELLDPLLYGGVRHPHGWRLHVENSLHAFVQADELGAPATHDDYGDRGGFDVEAEACIVGK